MPVSNPAPVAPPSVPAPTPPPPPPSPGPPRSAAVNVAMTKLQLTMTPADFALLDKADLSSPTLTQRLNEQVGKSITSIEYRSDGAGAFFEVGANGKGPIVIGKAFLDSIVLGSGTTVLSSAINDLLFVLGHEAAHAQNAGNSGDRCVIPEKGFACNAGFVMRFCEFRLHLLRDPLFERVEPNPGFPTQ